MSLQENQRRRPEREKRALDAPFSASHDDQVLTFFEWCQINRISERTGRRILDSDNAPKVTMLSQRKIGIAIRDNRAWQQGNERA
jgi:hypothetical protein